MPKERFRGLGQTADGMITKEDVIARGSTTKGVIPATRGVATRGVLTERLWSETSFSFSIRAQCCPGDGKAHT